VGLNFFQMIKKILLLILILFSTIISFSQNQAKIEYRYINFIEEYTSDNNKIKEKTPGYELFKMTEKFPFILIFDGSKSVFKIEEKMIVDDESITYKPLITLLPQTYIDFKNEISYDYSRINGQHFLIKEKLTKKWKIVDEKKLIKGYTCRKAIEFDEDGNIKTEAWFAPEIPLSIGPSYSSGLPGLVISTKEFNKSGEAYASFEFVNIDFSKQKKVIIPDYEPMTLKEFTDFMRGSRKKFN